jgi:hypothetical protein
VKRLISAKMIMVTIANSELLFCLVVKAHDVGPSFLTSCHEPISDLAKGLRARIMYIH